MTNIIKKIEEAGIVGRGGAAFPSHLKWKFTKSEKAKPKYVICNASEGEPGVCKDYHILKNHLEDIFKGMVLAMDYLKTKEGYFNLNSKYYKKFRRKLTPLMKKYKSKGYNFHIYEEPPSYIGGEESAMMNGIMGLPTEPRMKPPHSSEKGLFYKPTLAHNVETFFDIAMVDQNKYEDTRFISISYMNKRPKVYKMDKDITVEDALKQTKKYQKYDFFVLLGGGAAGIVLDKKQLKNQKLIYAASIEIFKKNISPIKFIKRICKFYKDESCGKCTPCREGSYQLYELVKNAKSVPWKKMTPIINTMEKSSFCFLGKSIANPIKSYAKNILKKKI